MGIPLTTIRDWLAEIRSLNPSEIEAYRARKRSTCDLLWSTLEEAALLRGTKLALEDGSASAMQAATVTAGICRDKNIGKPAETGRFGSSTKLVEPTPTHGILDRLNAASEAPPTPTTQASDASPGQDNQGA